MLAAALLWGTTGTAAALAPGVGSLAVGAAAMGVGGLLQAAAALHGMRAHRAGLAAPWRTLAVAAAAVAVYPLAFYTSMRLAGVAVGTVVSIGSAPMAAALVERAIDRQPLSRRWALGATAGVLGVLALAIARTGTAEPATGAVGARPLLGIALGLLAGLTYALYSWGAARVMRGGLPSRPVMGAIFGLGGVLLLPVLLLTGAPIVATWPNFAAVAYLAAVPMFLGYVLFGRGLAAVPASTATTLSLLEPAVAAVIAVLVLHERLPALGWVGTGVLLASLVVLTADPGRQHPDTASTPSPPPPREVQSVPQARRRSDRRPTRQATRPTRSAESAVPTGPPVRQRGDLGRREVPSTARFVPRGLSGHRRSG
ncbi:EamA/RhaT family transporter [Geodermatophilus sp. TF02-6]|nr:EamA/RhaT family transporter [Geodermatophilus sp. TF02-6]